MSDELEKAIAAVIAARAPDGQGREAAVAEAVRLARDVESYRHLLAPQHKPPVRP
jgi:hypothetical protein